jgi:hypothetical protein
LRLEEKASTRRRTKREYLRYNLLVARRCEVVLGLPNGRTYSITVEAESAFDAAVLFYQYCLNPPEGIKRPYMDPEATLEVRPIYKVRLQDAVEWANKQADKRSRLFRKE